jgi:hypothetical protein
MRRHWPYLALSVVIASCGSGSSPESQVVAGQQDATVSARIGPAIAWAWDRLFVYGGSEPSSETVTEDPGRLNDAYLLDIEDGSAEALPSPPFEHPLGVSAAAVASEESVTLVGTLCADEDRESASGDCDPGDYAAATLDMASRTWRAVDGRIVVATSSVGVNGELAAGPSSSEPVGGGEAYTESELRVFDLADSESGWMSTPVADTSGWVDAPVLSCGGDSALIHDGTGAGSMIFGPLDAHGQWTTTGDRPAGRNHQNVVWTGTEFIFIDASPQGAPGDGPSVAYRPDPPSWRVLAAELEVASDHVLAGDAIVSWSAGAEGGAVLVNDHLGE